MFIIFKSSYKFIYIVLVILSAISVTLIIADLAGVNPAFLWGSDGVSKKNPSKNLTEKSPVNSNRPFHTSLAVNSDLTKEIPAGSNTVSSLKGKVICLDPGHQAKADLTTEPIGPGSSENKIKDGGGAEGINSHTPEHKLVLDIGLTLKKLLEESGVTVVMTRTENNVHIGNVERANIANRAKADLFIRIHCDGSTDHRVSGTAVLYPASNKWTGPIYEKSKLAAQIIQENMVKECQRKDNGIVERNDLTGFNWSKVPVVLIETAYLSNPEEDRLLNSPDFRQKAAQGIYKGICEYFNKKVD